VEVADALALEGPQLSFTPGDDVAALLFARSAEVFGAFKFEAFALDEPEAEALEVTEGELAEGEGMAQSVGWKLISRCDSRATGCSL